MNSVALTVMNPQEKNWQSRGLNHNSLQNLRLVQIERICRQQNKKNCVGKGTKNGGKRRKCWLPTFSPFPHNVFKQLISQGR